MVISEPQSWDRNIRAIKRANDRPGKVLDMLQQVLLKAAVNSLILISGADSVAGDDQAEGQRAEQQRQQEDGGHISPWVWYGSAGRGSQPPAQGGALPGFAQNSCSPF